MADIQKQIVEFDKNIRLDWETEEKEETEKQVLGKKRKIILDKLRAQFDQMRKEGQSVPTFTDFNQGSYAMSTGVRPADGDYDIDVGLRFNCAREDFPNPVDLKILVTDALAGHTKLGIEVHKSCVRVPYQVDGEQAFHVDLAVYAYDDPKSQAKRLFLAKGERGSSPQLRWWDESDPQGLIDWVSGRFKNAQREQFLRVIRALKRWKTEKFKTDGQNAPSGIGLTVAAGLWFQPQVHTDAYAGSFSDDLAAMRAFVDAMVSRFQPEGSKADGSPLYRLKVHLPMAPGRDIFERMTVGQMTTFRERLTQLRALLDEVKTEPDPVRACQQMRQAFGEEFPVPDKQNTGRGGGRAVVSSGVSA